jgi:glycosyltransferase involved in cell wall biosynthesis
MGVIGSLADAEANTFHTSHGSKPDNGGKRQAVKPLVSLIVPAYNEAAIVEKNLTALYCYMETLEDAYRWEILVINDGSTDKTGALAESFAQMTTNVRVVHHTRNFGLGEALKTAFTHCHGDYIVTLDIDLSYSPDHIQKLLTHIRETGAKVVVASPYMNGGKTDNVPWLRRKLSKWANRFLSVAAKRNVSTLTGMVRAYDARFLKSVSLKSMGMEVNPEIIYKAMILHERVEEVPGHLDWHLQKAHGVIRKSHMRMLRHTVAVLLSGFLFRPVMFFIIPGFLLLLFALYVNTWVIIHFLDQYQNLPQYTWFFSRASQAVGVAYSQYPHTFVVGMLSSMMAIQLLSLGILALQSKSYFEEIFHLGTSIYRSSREKDGEEHK